MPSSSRSGLVLIIPGFAPAFMRHGPRLTALERLVAYSDAKSVVLSAHAQSESLEPWQCELLDALSLPKELRHPACCPSAPLTWLGANGTIDPGTWLHADPVMLSMAASGLSLERSTSWDEQSPFAVASLVGQHLALSQLTWHACGQQAFIHTSANWEVATMNPQAATLLEMHDALPRGRDATALRRLMTELQMLIHEKLPSIPDCNSFWLWGAGTAQISASTDLPKICTNDPYTRGIYLSADQSTNCNAFVDSLHALIEHSANDDMLIVVRDQDFEKLEQDWFAPAVQALDRGRFDTVDVYLDGWHVRADRSLFRRMFARPRPLHESLPSESVSSMEIA